jgi:hypothetical protein
MPCSRPKSFRALLASLVLVACTRGGAKDATPGAGTASKIAAEDGGGLARVADAAPVAVRDEDDGGADDTTPLPAISLAPPKGPEITVRALGTALLEVTVPGTTWKSVEVERHARSGGVPQTEKLERPRGPKAEPARSLHAANPGEEYVYRARVGNGAWSPEAAIRLPVSRRAPPPPSDVTAVAETPYAVRVSWKAETRAVTGFEVLVSRDGGTERTGGLVTPTERSFLLHLRVPGRRYTHRVRAFNDRGASPESAPVDVTMPTRDPGASAKVSLPPCKPLPKERDESKATLGSPRDDVGLPGGKPLYNDPAPTDGLERHLYGKVDGCFRDLGAFQLQADVRAVDGVDDEGFPLLHAIAGAGSFVGAQIFTLRYVAGRYRKVDEALFCGEHYPDSVSDPRVPQEGAGSDVTSYRPPFGSCQVDFGEFQ